MANAMSPEASGLLRSQVALINKVQRIDRDREVDFYHVEKGESEFPETVLFPNRAEELILAKIHITDPETGHQSKAEVFLVKGHLFSIEFSHTPRDFRGAKTLQISVEICADPMDAHG
ncbi:MAG: hypothetical protein GVY10_05725 [Verrucomicrobia bacterium]|nr:hypothetical protein [Verrucomicrobiota bacterium]